MLAPLPEYPAKTHARYLAALLERTGYLDIDSDLSIPISTLFGPGEGRMIGVLTALDKRGNEVILKAFSGTLGKERDIVGWVPHPMPSKVYDDFLKRWDKPIKALGDAIDASSNERQRALIKERAALSRTALDEYNTLFALTTITGATRSLSEIFDGPIPTGSGDCCAPKLLHYAFANNLRPVSMAECFFGSTTETRVHKTFYPPCTERCAPILRALLDLDIRYRDRDLLVVNKESGVLSVPGKITSESVETKVRRLFPQAPRQCAAHRLDMDTSGLLIIALTKEVLSAIHRLFREQQVYREYEALVEGIVKTERGEITLAFRSDPTNRPYQVYDPENGKMGVTHFERKAVEKQTDGAKATRIRFIPQTGRTHQLRLHAAHPEGLGAPILGDRLYGSGMVDRLYLHAAHLSFIHPFSRERITVDAPAPF